MIDRFFAQPILNSPYAYPARHWELDGSGQSTQRIVERRRAASFVAPIPKARKRSGHGDDRQRIVFDEGQQLSTGAQQYEPASTRLPRPPLRTQPLFTVSTRKERSYRP